MTGETHSKVQAGHLKRQAYLYIRQSTLRQVLEHTESTFRQYDLKQRAIGLGWKSDQIIVVDNDQGLSGASAIDRAGFQTLVTEVGMGRAGIVMGLEVSRLARNNSDWHRLLEICALTDTLILKARRETAAQQGHPYSFTMARDEAGHLLLCASGIRRLDTTKPGRDCGHSGPPRRNESWLARRMIAFSSYVECCNSGQI